MLSLKYLFKKIVNVDTTGLRNRVDQAKELSKKSKFAIYLDLMRCSLLYGAGYIDYVIFGMYSMNAKQRKNLLTGAKNNLYVAALNDRRFTSIFENKIKFLNLFENECGRDFLDLSVASKSDFFEFAKTHPVFIAKPVSGLCGKGIEKIDITSETNLENTYCALLKNNQTLLEEVILQHKYLSDLHASSINTIRIVTIVGKSGPQIVFSCLRMGTGGSVVDNFNSGGITVPININTGEINNVAVGKSGLICCVHPDSKIKFEGLKIPLWDECRNLALSAALKVDQVKYIGWDIALTPHGPLLVEGNHYPGHDVYQLVAQNPQKLGMLPIYNAVVPYKSLKRIKYD